MVVHILLILLCLHLAYNLQLGRLTHYAVDAVLRMPDLLRIVTCVSHTDYLS